MRIKLKPSNLVWQPTLFRYDRDIIITWPSHTEDAFAKLNGNHPSRARYIGDFVVPRCQRRGSTGRDLQRPRNSGQYAV